MKLEIQTTQTKTVDVKLPCYTETHSGYCKFAVLSETNIIEVDNWGADRIKLINTSGNKTAAFHDTFKQITEKEFCDFYKQTSDEIQQACNSFLDMVDEKRHDAQVDDMKTEILN